MGIDIHAQFGQNSEYISSVFRCDIAGKISFDEIFRHVGWQLSRNLSKLSNMAAIT